MTMQLRTNLGNKLIRVFVSYARGRLFGISKRKATHSSAPVPDGRAQRRVLRQHRHFRFDGDAFPHLGVYFCDTRHCHCSDKGVGHRIISLIGLALDH